jgi:hypothetical protein
MQPRVGEVVAAAERAAVARAATERGTRDAPGRGAAAR